MNESELVHLTFEEVYKVFQPMINSFVWKWQGRYDADDIRSICESYLWKAYEKYDYTTGVGFPHYANIVIGRRLIDELRKLRKHSEVLSLNYIMSTEEGSIEYQELILDTRDDIGNVENKLKVDNLAKMLTVLEKQVFDGLYTDDKKQKTIAKELNTSESSVSQIVKNIKKKGRLLN